MARGCSVARTAAEAGTAEKVVEALGLKLEKLAAARRRQRKVTKKAEKKMAKT